MAYVGFILSTINRAALCIMHYTSFTCSLDLCYLPWFWAIAASVLAQVILEVMTTYLMWVWLSMRESLVSRPPHHLSEKEAREEARETGLKLRSIEMRTTKAPPSLSILEEPGNISRSTDEKQDTSRTQQINSLFFLLTVWEARTLLEMSYINYIFCFLKNCTQSIRHLLVFVYLLPSPKTFTIPFLPQSVFLGFHLLIKC